MIEIDITKPIIFLDIDGVLATDSEYETKKTHPLLKCYPFNKKCVKVFNAIIEEINPVIILSSDWKYHFTKDEMNEIFLWNGINTIVTDFVPKGTNFTYSKHYLEECRAAEILDYVGKHKITNYVAVDDLHMGRWLNGNFVYCARPNEGIKQSGVKEKIINVLKQNIEL